MTPISLRAWAPPFEVIDFGEMRRRNRRRERLIRYGVGLAAIVLPSVVAIVVMGYVLGGAL
jgi:hypothetical protein